MTDWMTIRVVLSRQAETPLAQPPGRLLLVHADHAFADLAEAIDTCFGRWDLTPLHTFEVEGRVITSATDDPDVEDTDDVTIGEVGLREGARFVYVFDLGEGWTHECTVEDMGVDPYEVAGEEPEVPLAVFGWGVMPDQYGRISEDDDAGDDGDDETEDDWEPPEDDELDDDLDDWDAPEIASWQIVERALASVERTPDADALAEVTAQLRMQDDSWQAEVLWAGADVDPDNPPDDDEELWVALAGGVVAPLGRLPLDPDRLAAWAALEPADWAGAVIELVRAGPGAPVTPQSVLEAIAACPEVEEDELSEEGEETMLAGLEVVIELWRHLGVVAPDGLLTPLGHWGLPESLAEAWTGDVDDPDLDEADV